LFLDTYHEEYKPLPLPSWSHDEYYEDVPLRHISPLNHYENQHYSNGQHANNPFELLTSSQHEEYPVTHDGHHGYHDGESVPHLIDRLTTTKRCDVMGCRSGDILSPTNHDLRLEHSSDHIIYNRKSDQSTNPSSKSSNEKYGAKTDANKSTNEITPKEEPTNETRIDDPNYLGRQVQESLRLDADINNEQNDSIKHLQEVMKSTNQNVDRVNGQAEITNHLQEIKGTSVNEKPKGDAQSPNVETIVPAKKPQKTPKLPKLPPSLSPSSNGVLNKKKLKAEKMKDQEDEKSSGKTNTDSLELNSGSIKSSDKNNQPDSSETSKPKKNKKADSSASSDSSSNSKSNKSPASDSSNKDTGASKAHQSSASPSSSSSSNVQSNSGSSGKSDNKSSSNDKSNSGSSGTSDNKSSSNDKSNSGSSKQR